MSTRQIPTLVDWSCFTVAVAHMDADDLKEAHRLFR